MSYGSPESLPKHRRFMTSTYVSCSEEEVWSQSRAVQIYRLTAATISWLTTASPSAQRFFAGLVIDARCQIIIMCSVLRMLHWLEFRCTTDAAISSIYVYDKGEGNIWKLNISFEAESTVFTAIWKHSKQQWKTPRWDDDAPVMMMLEIPMKKQWWMNLLNFLRQ